MTLVRFTLKVFAKDVTQRALCSIMYECFDIFGSSVSPRANDVLCSIGQDRFP